VATIIGDRHATERMRLIRLLAATAGIKPALAKLRQADGRPPKKETGLGDSRNVERIREILRMQFDAAAADTGDPTKISILRELSATTADIPDAIIEAYWEIFAGLRDTELEYEMLRGIGIFWWPESATKFVERFISVSTGGD
jgi:hypothetical protein